MCCMATFDSHCRAPSSSLTAPPSHGLRFVIVCADRTRPRVTPRSFGSQFRPVFRSRFSRARDRLASVPHQHVPRSYPWISGPCIQRPNASHDASLWAGFSASFWRVGIPLVLRAQKPCTRGRNRPAEWSFWNPCGSDRREPKNTLAPNRLKARQLRRARQGLVRVSESNTKYGGKNRITGGDAASVMGPNICDSKGIRKLKKLSGKRPSTFRT